MIRLAGRRLAVAIPLVLGVVTLTFVLVQSAPGDPAALLLGDRPIPPEVRARIVASYGLDRPPLERYVCWLSALVIHGDLGWSISQSRPVARVLRDAVPATLLLSATALAIHLLSGIGLGVLAARWRNRWPDRAVTWTTLTLYALPPFWLGLMAILALCDLLPLFPPSSMRSVGADSWPLVRRVADVAWHMALPAMVLGLATVAGTSRFVRSGMVRALGEEFLRGARARGAGGRRVLFGHALRSALPPVLTLAGLSLPVLVSGSLVVEVVFAWPGMGRVAYDAILARDLPLVLASTLLTSLLVVAGSLAADLALAAADPRVRLPGSGDGA